MSLQVWLPLNGENSIIPDISSFNKESNITLTEDTNGWYKVIDSSHTSSRWGVYYDFTVKPGMTYTLQVYSKSTTGIPCSIGIQSFQGGIAWPAARDTNSTSTEKLTKYTWTTSQNDNKARIYLAMNPSSTIANNYVFYKQPRVYEAIHNQGIANVTVTANGSTSFTAGKIGQGLICNGSSFWNINPVTLGSEASICYWAKTSIAGKMPWVIVATASDKLNLWNYNNIYTLNTGDSVNNPFKDDNNNSIAVVIDNEWHHFSVTFGSNMAKLYIDGIYKGKAKTFKSPATTSAKTIRLAGGYNNAHSYDWNGMINDFRIYDNCLSQQQIKKIAQGLIVHYPLSDVYIESTENLITSEDCLSSTYYNGAISKYGYGTSTDTYKEVGIFQGKKCTKVYNKTNTTQMQPYVYINNMFTSDGTNKPQYKTLSFDYYTTISTSLVPYKLGSGSGTATYKVRNTEIKTGSGTNQVTIPVKPNMWNHIQITFHGTTEANSEWGYIRNLPTHTSNTSNYWLFANMQLEEKDHATGYAGVGGIRNSNIIYDCSGFCNNGTISGTLTISNDTPKYEISTYIPAVATITHNRCLDNINQEWSCAAWVKPKVAGNYQNLNNFNLSNRLYHGTYPLLYINSGANDYYNYGNLALPANQWSHIVFVFKNSTGTKLIYINGENHTNMGGPNKTSTPVGIPDSVIIGGGNYEGGLCDYREYATALSAEDVLSLYNNGAYIDQLNEIHGKVR